MQLSDLGKSHCLGLDDSRQPPQVPSELRHLTSTIYYISLSIFGSTRFANSTFYTPVMTRNHTGTGRRDEEAWQLVQDTFSDIRPNGRLSAPSIQPWTERMIAGYQARGLDEEAWQLVQDTFSDMRSNWGLSEPSIQPWTERMIAGYQEYRCYIALLKLYEDLLVANLQQGKVLKSLKIEKQARNQGKTWSKGPWNLKICDLSRFPELVEGFFSIPPSPVEEKALIQYIQLEASRATTITLLSKTIPGELRKIISSKLWEDREYASDARVGVGGHEFDVHKDVLTRQSPVFRAEFSDRYATRPTVVLDDEIFSKRSLGMMLSIMYGGNYMLPEHDTEVEEDIRAADYLDIVHLLEKDLSGPDFDRVEQVTKTQM